MLLTKAAEVPHLFKLTAAKMLTEVGNEALKEEKVKFWCSMDPGCWCSQITRAQCAWICAHGKD